MKFSKEALEADIAEGKTDTSSIMDLILEEGSKLIPGIMFTSDLPEANQSGKCSEVDMAVWADQTKGRHGNTNQANLL